MSAPVKITTPFPSPQETAKKLGVSKREAKMLSDLAKRSVKTGEFVIPGVGRLVQVKRAPAKGSAKSSRKRAVMFRVVKAT